MNDDNLYINWFLRVFVLCMSTGKKNQDFNFCFPYFIGLNWRKLNMNSELIVRSMGQGHTSTLTIVGKYKRKDIHASIVINVRSKLTLSFTKEIEGKDLASTETHVKK